MTSESATPRSPVATGGSRRTDSPAADEAEAIGRQHDRRSCERRARAAFTLIELLVVVAIVAILAAILLPVLGQAKRRTYLTKCASNQRQISMTIKMYADDSDAFLIGGKYNIPTAFYLTEYTTLEREYRLTADLLKCPEIETKLVFHGTDEVHIPFVYIGGVSTRHGIGAMGANDWWGWFKPSFPMFS